MVAVAVACAIRKVGAASGPCRRCLFPVVLYGRNPATVAMRSPSCMDALLVEMMLRGCCAGGQGVERLQSHAPKVAVAEGKGRWGAGCLEVCKEASLICRRGSQDGPNAARWRGGRRIRRMLGREEEEDKKHMSTSNTHLELREIAVAVPHATRQQRDIVATTSYPLFQRRVVSCRTVPYNRGPTTLIAEDVLA